MNKSTRNMKNDTTKRKSMINPKNKQSMIILGVASTLVSAIAFVIALTFYFDISPVVISLIVSVITMYIAGFSVYLMRSQKKSSEKDMYKDSKARYSEMREHIEGLIIEKQLKLAQSTDDWETLNHLLVTAQEKMYEHDSKQSSGFLRRFGIDDKNIKIEDNLIFMLTPFHGEYNEVYHLTRDVCEGMGFRLLRGDEIYIENDIFSYIVSNIVKASVVIANIEGRNPNVYFELGIAQALGKRTILIAKGFDDVPFNIRNNRILLYDNARQYEKAIREYIKMATDAEAD